MGNVVSVTAQIVLSTALVAAGAVVAATSFGGAAAIAGGLISAGVSGATAAITNCVQGESASWKEWGESSAIGAVTGLVGGALCAGAGGFANGITEGAKWAAWKVLAVRGDSTVAGAMTSSVACNALTNVWHGRKPLEGVGVALAVGAVGGAFACGGAAAWHSLKNSSTSWLAHPLTRHGAGVVIDTASSVVSGVFGAGLTGQDMGQAALLGVATGVAVNTFTTSVRASKSKIRRKQHHEKANRVQVEGVHQENGVSFVYVQSDQDGQHGHRDVEHVDRHRRGLKDRFVETPRLEDSSRFYDLETANKVREMATVKAVRKINEPGLPEIVLTQRDSLVEKIRRLDNLQASARATPQKIDRAERALENARQLFDRTVASNMRQVDVNVHVPECCGYGYRNDRSLTRQFNIRDATSHFKAIGRPDGSMVWREISSYSNSQQPRSWTNRVVTQRLLAGDRLNRRPVSRNVLMQRHTAQYHNREADEHLVGA
ncbi:hypothetical protein PHYPSEUDO_014819 [Phytophthora pseudosyringae]|uniref:Uncharacterized protein n=1 Tax=Phytophthora pseudosyringae TaxID=221518 RepID=A0A8T1W575_9STRA|nr:hypothetical protein PHYPSEUDO_014819 [Phytophthora pseudosyringae]